MAMCHRLHKENAIFPMDENKVRAVLRKGFDRQGGILGVIGNSGKIEGMICLLVTEFWYASEPFIDELFLYVCPEYRHTKNAIDLMKFAKWCSDQSGFPLVIGVLSNERTAGKIRLYQRQFDRPAGNFFYYNQRQPFIYNEERRAI